MMASFELAAVSAGNAKALSQHPYMCKARLQQRLGSSVISRAPPGLLLLHLAIQMSLLMLNSQVRVNPSSVAQRKVAQFPKTPMLLALSQPSYLGTYMYASCQKGKCPTTCSSVQREPHVHQCFASRRLPSLPTCCPTLRLHRASTVTRGCHPCNAYIQLDSPSCMQWRQDQPSTQRHCRCRSHCTYIG